MYLYASDHILRDKKIRIKIMAVILVSLSILSFATSVLAMSEEDRNNFMKMSEHERKFLLMYFDEDEIFVVSDGSTGSP